MASPQAVYDSRVSAKEIQPDSAQLAAIALLQTLYKELCKTDVESRGLIKNLFSPKPLPVKGLYFWGGVGRGKTFLMDLFFESLPIEKKRRLHFHRFMREVHKSLNRLQGEPNPLKRVAKNFSLDARVICFDEFFVSDITDAMLLAGLLQELFSLGVTLVATSNVEPDNLYANGLQRAKFLPAIDLLKEYTQVHNLDGGVDYRLRALEAAEIYHYPHDESAEIGLAQAFRDLSPDVGKENANLFIEGRQIKTRCCGDGIVWFDFAMICDGPRSQNDYVELAHVFQTVLIGKVPVFTAEIENQARRFISLVDEFYDRNVKLIISAEASIFDLYRGDLLVFEFRRTESRLQEMQSRDYLVREHLP